LVGDDEIRKGGAIVSSWGVESRGGIESTRETLKVRGHQHNIEEMKKGSYLSNCG